MALANDGAARRETELLEATRELPQLPLVEPAEERDPGEIVGEAGPCGDPSTREPLSQRPSGRVQPMTTDYFGEDVAARYDDPDDEMSQAAAIDPVVDFIAELAGGGAALELGIGTGRIALPLSQRGVRVHGIDLSEAMVARLQAKPGAEEIGVTIGDFATTTVEGSFSVSYLVFNTIMNLTTQDAQVACFRNAAAHLEPGGCFVIEVMLPDLQRLPAGETIRPFTVTPTRLGFDEYDIVRRD